MSVAKAQQVLLDALYADTDFEAGLSTALRFGISLKPGVRIEIYAQMHSETAKGVFRIRRRLTRQAVRRGELPG